MLRIIKIVSIYEISKFCDYLIAKYFMFDLELILLPCTMYEVINKNK